MLGKIDASLNAKLKSVEWGEYRLDELFEIQKTLGYNTDSLVHGNKYDYITRTSMNQGIMRTTGFVGDEKLNPAGVWSLGLLQMDFFYRNREWYAGQFMRKVVPKFSLSPRIISFMTTLLNKQKRVLLSVLVRDVDDTFNNLVIKLPVNNGNIDFEFIEDFIAELEAERIAELEAYLKATGLNNYTITADEQYILDDFINHKVTYHTFKIIDIFHVNNTHNILKSEVEFNSGNTPYVTAGEGNNSIASYISYKDNLLDEGNSIFIGGKTLVISYQPNDYFSNDSHNLALYIKDSRGKTENAQLFMVSALYKSLKPLYSWGDSISRKKIQKDVVELPVNNNGQIDYDLMDKIITIQKKIVIKNVIDFTDKKITATKQIINKQ